MAVILELLRERIGQPSKPSHAHSHRQILPLNIARADVLRIGASVDHCALGAETDCGTLTPLWRRGWRIAVLLHQHGVIDGRTELTVNRVQIGSVAVCG